MAREKYVNMMENCGTSPLLMIGLDAAEITLVERWMEEGLLPNLRSLREQGAFGRLKSTADWLVGSPWPSFYTGTPPAEHGMYHYLIWRPEHMVTERPSPDWLPLRPFWRGLGDVGRRVVAVDVPVAYAPDKFEGIEISGWATHETLEPPASHPPQLMDWVEKKFGKPPFDNEETYLLSAAELLRVRDQCVRTSELVGDLGVSLMQEAPWDLFLICFAATHRGGHQLWDLTSMQGDASPAKIDELKDALKKIYIACDTAIGRLIEQAGPRVHKLVFSVHGMGPNVSRSDVLREMLTRILSGRGSEDGPAHKNRLADRLRAMLPVRLRSWVKNTLPISAQDRLTLFWRTGGIDWSETKAFAAFCDLDGYIRINLRGREAAGIVERGTEYEELCAQIIDGLRTFVDGDTGDPVVDAVGQLEELFPEGRRRYHLPDLMVRWSPRPAAQHRFIKSNRYGTIPWPTPGHHPQGRSGNHWPDGFFFLSGERVRPGTMIEDAHILDLAPTVFSLLDLSVPEHLYGRALF